MERFIIALLAISLVLVLLFNGVPGFLGEWLNTFITLLRHVFFVGLDFVQGAVFLLIHTIRELISF